MTEEQSNKSLLETARRSRWGRVKFGARRASTLWIAVPAGLILASAITVLVLKMSSTGAAQPFIIGVIIAFVTFWPCTAFVWTLIVDRSTLRSAIPNPEQSVETAWHQRAASGAFSDVGFVVGPATAVIGFADIEFPAALALGGVIFLSLGSFSIRYFIQTRRS